MMVFDDFQPGATLGQCDFTFSREALDQWVGLFPDDRQTLPAMPPAMIAMVLMRAFMAILPDRPRGNIHAGQKIRIARLPQLNDRMTTGFSCIGKELKSGRRWLTFASDCVDSAGLPLFQGQMKTIWAA